ncbi:MAG: hypothetical protein LBM16_00405, partial [Clostridiales bacterium]|nr:hypothetical protein [Clostridiales bacterium]
MTEKLFYVDAYETEFEATVISYESKNGKFAVLLDRTLFYPTGGGQPCDTGTIGGLEVVDVYEKDGDIFHVTNVPISGTVKGIINWSRRFSLMQNHSGEHIISGIVNKRFGFD